MKNDLTCAVVRDLLPSYIDKLTSEETNKALEQHLKGCADCRNVLSSMQKGCGAVSEDPVEEKEIDYLKKVREGTWKRQIAAILAMVLLFGAGVWYKVYRYGSYVDPSSVVIQSVRKEGENISVAGYLKNRDLGVTHTDLLLAEDGVMEIGFRAARKGGLDNAFDSGVSGETYAGVREIRMGRRIIWYEGTLIDEQVSDVFNARHAYIGDMSANIELADALGIHVALGPYTNELVTDSEPYGWRICLQQPIAGKDTMLAAGNADKFFQIFGFSRVMIACVDNLDWVEFEYTVDNGKTGVYRVDAAQASEMVSGKNISIKDCAADPASLQALMDALAFGNF